MGFLGKLFGRKSFEQNKDIISNLFREEKLRGKRIEAVAIIYEGFTPMVDLRGGVKPGAQPMITHPPKRKVGELLVQQCKQSGFIGPDIAFPPDASIEMRELKEGESTTVPSINDSLASMLADQLRGRNLNRYTALPLRGDCVAFGMVWSAVAAK